MYGDTQCYDPQLIHHFWQTDFLLVLQVGSRFGESTLKFGSMLTDGQVGRFGDILPVQAAGLLSSFTAARSDS